MPLHKEITPGIYLAPRLTLPYLKYPVNVTGSSFSRHKASHKSIKKKVGEQRAIGEAAEGIISGGKLPHIPRQRLEQKRVYFIRLRMKRQGLPISKLLHNQFAFSIVRYLHWWVALACCYAVDWNVSFICIQETHVKKKNVFAKDSALWSEYPQSPCPWRLHQGNQ